MVGDHQHEVKANGDVLPPPKRISGPTTVYHRTRLEHAIRHELRELNKQL